MIARPVRGCNRLLSTAVSVCDRAVEGRTRGTHLTVPPFVRRASTAVRLSLVAPTGRRQMDELWRSLKYRQPEEGGVSAERISDACPDFFQGTGNSRCPPSFVELCVKTRALFGAGDLPPL